VGPRRAVALAIALGVATGILTLAGQAVLPAEWNRLANSGAVWTAVAFVVGSRSPTARSAAVLGTVTLLLALVSYDLAARITAIGLSTTGLVIWGATAIVAGPLAGLGGWLWRSPGRWSMAGPAFVGAVFSAEGLHTLLRLPELAKVGWIELAVGPVIVLVLGRTNAERARGLMLFVPLLFAGTLAYLALDVVLGA
jgi:hypothetical protein